MPGFGWRPIPEFSDYEIDGFGTIRRRFPSFATHPETGKISQQYPAGRLLKPSLDTKGYPRVCLRKEGKGHWRGIHVLVCLIFNGPKPSLEHEVAHWNRDKTNNHYTNLRWATRKENADDRRRHGTHRERERHSRAKLTESAVEGIRQANGVPLMDLAALYGVSLPTIYDVLKNRTWKEGKNHA